MIASSQNANFQLGLLHFAYLLAMVDGVIDDREQNAIRAIASEESISKDDLEEFDKTIRLKPERDIYHHGLNLLNRCTEDEKRTVFVHLYRLSKADDKIHVKEVRFLLYSLKATHVEFEDIELIAKLNIATKKLIEPDQKSAA